MKRQQRQKKDDSHSMTNKKKSNGINNKKGQRQGKLFAGGIKKTLRKSTGVVLPAATHVLSSPSSPGMSASMKAALARPGD